MTTSYTKTNLRTVENQAPNFGMPEEMEARFARRAIDGETLGLSLFTLAPGFRIPFGHKHESQEEVYVVVRGSARVKVEDEIVELREWDAIRVPKSTMRQVEAGPDGVDYLAFGAGNDPTEVEMALGRGATSHRSHHLRDSRDTDKEESMYATIRSYSGGGGFADALVEREDEIRNVIGSIDGFQGYYVLRTTDGVTTISVFDDQAGAEASTSAAAAYIAENMADASPGAPQVTTGEVVLSF